MAKGTLPKGRGKASVPKTSASRRRTPARDQSAVLLAALAAVGEGVSVFDAGLVLVAANARFAELLTLPPEMVKPGVSLRDILAFQAARGDFGSGQDASVEHRIERYWQADELELERPYHGDRVLRVRRRKLADESIVSVYADITETKRAEAALRHSEHRFKDFAEAGSDWLWEWDTERRYTWHSPRLTQVTGRPEAFYIGKRREDVGLVDTDDPSYQRNLDDIANRRPFRDFRFRSIYPYGPRWFQQSGKPVYDNDGTFLGYRGTGRDVTALVEAEAQARLAQDRLAQAIGGLPHCFAQFDRDGHMVACNDAYRRMHPAIAHLMTPGVHFIDLLRASLATGIPSIPPEEHEAYLARRLAYHHDVNGSFERPLADGGWQEILESPLPDGGWLVIIHDITARKRAEAEANRAQAELAAAMDSMPLAIGIFDPHDRLLIWNRAYDEMHARLSQPLVAGTTLTAMIEYAVAHGFVGVPQHERDAYLARRLAFHANPVGGFEFQLNDGVWQELHEYRLPDGRLMLVMENISERKRAEEALRASEQRFRDFAEAASDWLWEWDTEQRLTYVSERVAQVFGQPVENFLGRRREEIGAVDADPTQRAAYEEAIAKRDPFHVSYRLTLAGGRQILISSSGKPRFAPDGTFLGYLGTGRDITATVAMEQAAQLAQDRLAAAINSMPVAIGLFDTEDCLVTWNRAYEELHHRAQVTIRAGMTFRQLIDAGATSTLIGLAAAERDAYVERRLAFHANPVGGFERCLSDGSWQELREYRLPDGGLMMAMNDITERKQAEEALRRSEQRLALHLDQTPIGAVEWDPQGRVVVWNRAAEQIFGYSREEVIGRRSFDLIVPKRTRTHVQGTLDRLWTGDGGQRSTNENVTKDGRTITCDWHNTTLIGADGEVVGIAALVQDITERMHAEAELREAKEAAEASDRAKSEFLANISHELRTPLNAIIGFSEVIAEAMLGPVGTPRYVEYARDIRFSGVHLLSIINDLLDISKIEAGRFELHEEMASAAELAEASLRLVRERAEKGGVHCEIAVMPDLPPLLADPRAMKQILLNLLSNAVKFTEPGGRVTLSVEVDAAGGLVYVVADTGIGIRPEDIPRALAPFTQIDSQFTRRHEGTGLGLPLARKLVELHGGSLDLASTPGQGTTVTVRLPTERLVPERKVANKQ
jgi:PAS domain S-box-containing protein